jgi:cathepsin L
MKLFVLALVLVAASAVCAMDDDEADWQRFKLQFGKLFLSKGKETKRRAAFKVNKAKLDELAVAADAGEISYRPKMYAFHDLEHEEMKARLTGLKVSEEELNKDAVVEVPTSRQSIPATFDARDKGWISAPRNQGSCGSCWTFSTMSAIEAGYAKRYGTPVDLAEQQLVDCGKRDWYTNAIEDGCEGGWMPSAFEYLINNGGAVKEYLYPYAGIFQTCQNKKGEVGVSDWVQIDQDDNSIKNAILTYGSLAIAVDADEWFSYGSGVFHAKQVGDINHAVNLIGWGADYWLVRNSWGSDWGEKGTIRLAKTTDGTYAKQYTFAVKLA